jgi:DNA-binding response OmpR family regulator
MTETPVKPRVLVVEDQPQMRDVMLLFLERTGYEVVGAHTARAALEAVEEAPCAIALVDLTLPDLHGVELIIQLRALKEAPVCFILTGSDEAEAKRCTKESGACGWLTKPFSLRELSACIKQALAEGGKTE